MKKNSSVQEVIEAVTALAPESYAIEGDPIGLHFGKRDQPVHKVLVTLDVRPEVVEEAKEVGADMIFSHHPVIFHSPKVLTEEDPQQAMYAQIIRHGLAVYSAHTNLDAAEGGMNDWLAEAYGLEDVHSFGPHAYEQAYRLITYVPWENVTQLEEALAPYPIGQIGNYSHCQFAVQGEGSFIPNDEAHPAIGQRNTVSRVEEVALSFIAYEREYAQVVEWIKANHPYEEPVVDVIPLANGKRPIAMGRIGRLKEPLRVKDYVEKIKALSGKDGVRYISPDPQKKIQRVAVLGGGGSSYYPKALAAGAEVYLTGDVDYHTGHDILANGLSVIDPGHAMENICIPKMTAYLREWFDSHQKNIEIVESQVDTDPFHFA